MFGSKSKPEDLGWTRLERQEQFDEMEKISETKPVLIFKHSTSCGISAMIFDRLKGGSDKLTAEVAVFYLDLLSFRPISNEVAARYNILHQSPQVLLLKNGKVDYHKSHHSVSPEAILGAV